MVNLKQARETGKLDKFIAEREAKTPEQHGDPKAFNRALASMAGTSKEAPATSKKRRSAD